MDPVTGCYADYPKDIPLATPFGEVYLAVTDGHHVHVDFSHPERPLLVRAESVWGGLHLWRQPDGTFGPEGRRFGASENTFKPHTGRSKPVPPTTKAKLFDAIVHAVTEWARENGALFEAAETGRHEADRQALQGEIARLEDELRQRREDLAALEQTVIAGAG